jgi:hypothetical protein
MDRNPAYRPGLVALVTWLIENQYSTHAIEHIEGFVAAHGTLAGSMIEPEDQAVAEAVFVEALPAVPLDAESWRDPGVYIDAPSILEAADRRRIPRGAILIPPELDEYEPSAEDLAEYGAWLETLDREHVAAMVAPIAGGAPDDDDPMTVPATYDRMRRDDPARYREHQRRFQVEVEEFYVVHPGA